MKPNRLPSAQIRVPNRYRVRGMTNADDEPINP